MQSEISDQTWQFSWLRTEGGGWMGGWIGGAGWYEGGRGVVGR